MKKSEIQKEAEKLMKNKGVDIVHATSDGQLFFEQNAAELHRDSNAKGEKLTVFTFGEAETAAEDETDATAVKPKKAAKKKVKTPKADTGATETPLQISAREAREDKAKIATIEDVAELNKLEAAENEREKPRTSIIKAIGARNAALQADGGEKTDEQRKADDK